MSHVINFGGGEIWEAIGESLRHQNHTTFRYGKEVCDVADHREVDAIVAKEKPDWIIMTAGVSHLQEIDGMDIHKVADEFCTNAIGALSIARAMKKYGVNNFIALISVAGLYGKPNHAGYSASKAALRSIVQSMAMEGINAYGISPGRVNTAMRQKDYAGENPETRLCPEEIALVVTKIMQGKHKPGDNIIIRRIGVVTQPIKVDNGSPWKKALKVGEPVTV